MLRTQMSASGDIGRRDLPSISAQRDVGQQKVAQDKSQLLDPLGYHSGFGPPGGPGRWEPGFPAIWNPSSSIGRRAAKSTGASTRIVGLPPTQIVMFPTPTHAVPLLAKTIESNLSTSSLPQVVQPARPSLPSSSSAPSLIRPSAKDQLQIPQKALRRPSREAEEVAPPPAKPGRRRLGASSPVMFAEEDALVSTVHIEAREEESTTEREPTQRHAPLRTGEHRRTFHHSYYQNEDGGVETTVEDSIRSDPRLAAMPRMPVVPPRAAAAAPSPQEREELKEDFRDVLIEIAGGVMEAFRCMDLSGSGQISRQEFQDGVARLGIPWEEITGLTAMKDLFKWFSSKDGVIRLHDLFPQERILATPPNRMSTPEFWGHWCRNNNDDEFEKRVPKWKPFDKDEELQNLFAATRAREDVTDRKRWMSSTIRRMKSQGKSDARCREMCAQHLPRGTGPRDKEYVHTFSQMEVKTCRRDYNDKVSIPVRNIQKTVYEMREQRMQLQMYKRNMKHMAQLNARRQDGFEVDEEDDLEEDDETLGV